MTTKPKSIFSRIPRILFFLGALFLWLSSHSVKSQENVSTEEKRPENAAIRLGYSYDLMYHRMSDGREIGVLVPLIQLLRNDFGLDVEVRKMKRDEAFRQLMDDKLDFYGMTGMNAEHREKYLAIGPFYRTEGMIASRIDRPVRSLINLQGKKVGILDGSTLEKPLFKFVDSEEMIVRYPTLNSMITALEKGQIDCLATLEGAEIEILRNPNVNFEFSANCLFIEQGMICAHPAQKDLADKINNYLKTTDARKLLDEIVIQRNEVILQMHRELLAEEIAHVRQQYQTVDMYESGIFYPFSYKENDAFKGMLTEINQIFTKLTGVEVRVDDFDHENKGIIAALEKIQSGQCQVTLGGYANVNQLQGDGVDFSPNLWTDTIHAYSYGKPWLDLTDARIGTTPNLKDYFPWEAISHKPLIIYASRKELIDDLKKGKIDVVVLGDMCMNYQHAVLRDFRFRELDGLMAKIEMHLVYGSGTPELNRLFNESIRLYHMLHPEAQEYWQKQAERANADYIRHKEMGYRRYSVLLTVLVVLVVAILILFSRFVKYDNQIRKLLQKQQTFDLAWINLRSGRFISKANHPFYRAWGLNFSGPVCSLKEMSRVFERDLATEYRDDLEKMKVEGLNFVVQNGSIISPLDGQKKYYRRYLHRLSDYRLMLCLQDTNAQHESEQQEEFLNQLFDTFKDGLLFLDKDLNVLRYNRSMTEFFPLSDPTKKHCYDCFRDKTEPCLVCPIRETLRDGKKHSYVEYSQETGRWIELTSFPIRNTATNEVDRVLEFVQDVTDQRARETELVGRKIFLEAILNASNDGIIAISDEVHDEEEGAHVNSRLIEMFDGYGASIFNNEDPEIRTLHKRITINPEDIYEARDRNRLTNEPGAGILYFHDGRMYRWRLNSTQTGIGKTGYTRIWTFHDITEEHRAAERIRDNEEYLRTLFDTMPCGLGTFVAVRGENDEVIDFLFTSVNLALEKIVGFKREQLIGQSLANAASHVHIADDPTSEISLVDINRMALDGKAHVFLVHDPVQKNYQQIISFFIGSDRVGMFVADETTRIASEMALRKSEEKFRAVFDQMPNGLALFDVVRNDAGEPVQFLYSDVNPVLERFNGFSSELTRGKTMQEVCPDIHLISDNYELIDTEESWIFIYGLAALQGHTGECMAYASKNNSYQRLSIFSTGQEQLGIFVMDITPTVEATRSLRSSEQQIRSLFASMTNGVFLLEILRDESGKPVDYRIVSANPASCEMLDMTPKQLLENQVMELFGKQHIVTEFGERWWTGIELASQGISGTYHIRFPKLPASEYQEFVVFPVGDNQIGILMYDETYRIRSEKQLRLMQMIIDNVSQPVFWLFLDGTIQYANEAAAVAWGFSNAWITPDGPIGDKVWKFDQSVSSESWSDFLSTFHNDIKFQKFDTLMRRKDGTLFPAVVTVNLLEQNDEPFFAACFQDLTDQTRRIEAEQRALAKSSFLDHMTHEIRTPLNGVIGITDLMLNTNLDEKQREYAEMSKVSAYQLLTIVSNIFDFTLLDSGELELDEEAFDLREFIKTLHSVILAIARERNSELEINVTLDETLPKRIVADPVRLRQVLHNLLDNSLKFTEEGRVSLDVKSLASPPETEFFKGKDGPVLEFTVTDTGRGISQEKLEALFEAFAMEDASFSRKYGGTGLGLPIARGLVQVMGGETYVESVVGVGSKFWFVIPLILPEESDEEADIVEEPTVSEPKKILTPEEITVLVVEDNRINRIVTGEILKQTGYNYEFAEDGQQACDAVATKKFDLILMDCQMPVMDGFEATQKIRAMETGEDEHKSAHKGHVPIVALTANALAGDEQNCYDAGMDDFCSKPVKAEQLVGIIRKWLQEG